MNSNAIAIDPVDRDSLRYSAEAAPGTPELLPLFQLGREVIAPALRAGGAAALTTPLRSPWDQLWLHALLDDEQFQARVRARAAQARTRLHGYLAQQGFFDSARVGLVDVGWSGSIQDCLQRA